MGVSDDGVGAAGPAGPIARAFTVRMSGDIFNVLGAYAIAFTGQARIISMSYGARIPVLASFVLAPFDLATKTASAAGMLLLAAAGNDSSDIDAKDCAPPFDWPCWEKAWQTPCENAGVTCIGALNDNATTRRPTSNYGSKDVDLFGPGHVWVGGDPGDPEPHNFTSTSAATPFVAGVAALVLAADPELLGADVARMLIDSARPSGDPQVRRYVDANAAVLRGLGAPPVCLPPQLVSPPPFALTPPCESNTFTVTVITDGPTVGPYTYAWRRYVDGAPVNMTDGGRISGTSTPAMTINPFLATDVGTYDVFVTSPCGDTASGRTLVNLIDGGIEQAPALVSQIASHAMAYDRDRERMVLHGGHRGIVSADDGVAFDVSNETWERPASGEWQFRTSAGP
jgi:subtilisin family serine protease